LQRINANQRLSNVSNETMQYVRDLLQYCSNYVTKSQTTRIEETIRSTQSRGIDCRCIERISSFRQDGIKHHHQQFLCRDVLYRLCNWRRHFNTCVGEDLQVLRKLIVDREYLDTMSWVAPLLTSQIIWTEFRVMYFVHGNSIQYNFSIVKHMFTNGLELRAIDGPFVRLRVLIDLNDTFRYPLFTTRLPANELAVVKHIWFVMCDVWWQYRYHGREEEEDPVNEPSRFLVTVYATWAYTQIRRKEGCQ